MRAEEDGFSMQWKLHQFKHKKKCSAMALSVAQRNKVNGSGQKQFGSSVTVIPITSFFRKAQQPVSLLKISATI